MQMTVVRGCICPSLGTCTAAVDSLDEIAGGGAAVSDALGRACDVAAAVPSLSRQALAASKTHMPTQMAAQRPIQSILMTDLKHVRRVRRTLPSADAAASQTAVVRHPRGARIRPPPFTPSTRSQMSLRGYFTIFITAWLVSVTQNTQQSLATIEPGNPCPVARCSHLCGHTMAGRSCQMFPTPLAAYRLPP